jgi:hypothetical protein
MIEVLKQALEALELEDLACRYEKEQTPEHIAKAIASLRQAIAELESQEPVATVTSETGADITMSWWHEPALPVGLKLYAHPPQRTWQGLTDEEIDKAWRSVDYTVPWEQHRIDIAKAIEAKLKERNI